MILFFIVDLYLDSNFIHIHKLDWFMASLKILKYWRIDSWIAQLTVHSFLWCSVAIHF
jgi:hypothetical protein